MAIIRSNKEVWKHGADSRNDDEVLQDRRDDRASSGQRNAQAASDRDRQRQQRR